MEPASTTLMIGTVVGYLAEKFKQNKSIQSFLAEFTEETVNWIKPIFLTDDESHPKEVLESLQQKPDSVVRKKALETAFEVALENNPKDEKFLIAMFESIKKNIGGDHMSHIIGDNNVTGNISAGGNIIIGNNNGK